MDGAIMVVAGTDGQMPQTREHLLLAKQVRGECIDSIAHIIGICMCWYIDFIYVHDIYIYMYMFFYRYIYIYIDIICICFLLHTSRILILYVLYAAVHSPKNIIFRC